eukprot:scaffold42731_cov237-Amphora_coffeaeformis.AAC.2
MSETTTELTMEALSAQIAELQAALDAAVTAQETSISETNSSIDMLFVFAMGVVCFFLQAGFGLLEAGGVRAKNAQNIMVKNLMDAVVTALVYYFFGYSISYAPGGGPFIGGSDYMGLQVSNLVPEDNLWWYFNFVFAGTTATIVSGAVAERCQFRAYLCYSAALAGFIYPVCAHWIWSPDGFLNGKVYDFAGGGAVHMVGGVAAMMGSIILGPRLGKFVTNEQGKKVPVDIPGHNAVLMALGALILWFGFFAFNGGSSYSITGPDMYDAVGRAVVNTTLAGASGSMTLLFWGYLVEGHWSMGWIINGLLAGMVSTCSGVNSYESWVALICGILGAITCQLQIELFEKVLFIDDPLNASAVHLGAGGIGMIFVAFCSNPDYGGEDFAGIFYGGSGSFLGNQIYAMVVYSAWTAVTSGVLFFGLKQAGWFRISEEDERLGADATHHGGKAYLMDDDTIGETKHQLGSDSDDVVATTEG